MRNGSYVYYVQGTTYRADGQVDLRSLAGGTLNTDYNYFGWSVNKGLGRLQQILTTTTATPPVTLQDLRYTYDDVGNVMTIKDYVAGSPQTQTFIYDLADRLTSAVASGGTGGTFALENYVYNGTTGNLSSKAGISLTYNAQVTGCVGGDRTIPHAVSAMGANSFTYDCNGNMSIRTVIGTTYNLSYDGDGRLLSVAGGATANFLYDGDGNRVKSTIGGSTTVYIGNYFEWIGSTSKLIKYFYAGTQRVAMKKGSTVYYLFGDHLGSTSITTNSSGTKVGELRYKPWGETRYTWGTTYTNRHFTGQGVGISMGVLSLIIC